MSKTPLGIVPPKALVFARITQKVDYLDKVGFGLVDASDIRKRGCRLFFGKALGPASTNAEYLHFGPAMQRHG